MEMTQEQKEYQKNYRIANKERLREVNRLYREKNRDRLKTYHQIYYIEHKEHMLLTAKRWREANKGDFVYFYINSEGDNIYVGSTSRPLVERSSFHLLNHSNLNCSAEDLVNDYHLECILFKNFDKYNLSREDLYFIERYYIETTGSILNKQKIVINEENLTRSTDELIEIAESTKFEQFNKLDRYLN